MDDEFDFSEALAGLRIGHKLARAGWNGKGMFVWLVKGSIAPGEDGSLPDLVNGVTTHLFEHGDKGTVTRMPHLCMRAADGSTVTGWLASQTDMMAEDWMIVE